MLNIKNLTVEFDNSTFLNGVNLTVKPGEIHAIMGPALSGKSFISHAIFGNPNLMFVDTDIRFNNKSIMDLTPGQRSKLGLFCSFQDPAEIPGVTNFNLMVASAASHKQKRSLNELAADYKKLCKSLFLPANHGAKIVNQNIEPADIMKNEILQMLMLDPTFVVLDEVDMNLEEDDAALIGNHIKEFFANKNKAGIIITNNILLLDIIAPTHVHILVDGEIQEEGSTELYKRIVNDGNPELL